MKKTDKAAVIIFTCCLILLSVLIPLSVLVTSEDFYTDEFKKISIYPQNGETTKVYYINGNPELYAKLTQEQFDVMTKHFTDFLSNEKPDFTLTLDNVLLNGKITNGVSIFGEEAVVHMTDVRDLFNQCTVIEVICIVLAVICAVYMIIVRKRIKTSLFKYALIPVLILVGAALLFVTFTAIAHIFSGREYFFDTLWEWMHVIFFPFSPDKVDGSMFNDALTSVLNADFFLNVVIKFVSYLSGTVSLWLISSFFISKRANKSSEA